MNNRSINIKFPGPSLLCVLIIVTNVKVSRFVLYKPVNNRNLTRTRILGLNFRFIGDIFMLVRYKVGSEGDPRYT